MIKRIILTVLSLIMIFSFAGCKEETQPTESMQSYTESINYTVDIDVMDEWREDEGDTRNYYVTLSIKSNTIYDVIEASDIQYSTENGYIPLTEAIAGTDIIIKNLNEDMESGTLVCAKIRSNQLIDKKKIVVRAEGPSKKDSGCTDKESYIKKYGTDAWGSILARISSGKYVSAELTSKQNGKNYGLIAVADNNTTAMYFDQRKSDITTITENDKYYVDIPVEVFNSIDIPTMYEAILVNARPTNDATENSKAIELNENIKMFVSFENNTLRLGYQTADGASIDTYVDGIPSWIRLTNMSGYSFVQLK